jgi:hypothetical protein
LLICIICFACGEFSFQLNLAAWMYVSRDKSQAVVFAFSLNSDHWSNLVPRLQLQGLLPEAEYEVSEPMPNNVTQASGNLMIIETEGKLCVYRQVAKDPRSA